MVDFDHVDTYFQFLFHIKFVHRVGITHSFFAEMKGHDDSSPWMRGKQRPLDVVHGFDVDGVDDTVDLDAGATLRPT
jgi:hypothetical protein